MVALNIAPDEDAQVPAWREARKYTFPIVLAGAEDFAKATYGVSVAPTNLLLNGEGKAPRRPPVRLHTVDGSIRPVSPPMRPRCRWGAGALL